MRVAILGNEAIGTTKKNAEEREEEEAEQEAEQEASSDEERENALPAGLIFSSFSVLLYSNYLLT